ncbi:hypothetical protein PS906_03240 [Pseudomonas fluorescens]|nr:hypothetical protein PS906_03240 [Pseudomonas fluorescens]
MGRAKEKNSTDDYRSLDIRALHRAGLLRAGFAYKWVWKRTGELVGQSASTSKA